MENKITIEGEKVILRKVGMSDVTDNYVSWLNDEEVVRGLATVPKPYTKEMLKQYITDIVQNENTHMFMIVEKKTGKDIGTIKIHNHDKVNGTCNLGIMVGDRTAWGNGYGPDALKTAITYAFTILNVRKICESVHSNNPRALLTDLKIGFHVEGVMKSQLLVEGKYIDKILIALFAKDWDKK